MGTTLDHLLKVCMSGNWGLHIMLKLDIRRAEATMKSSLNRMKLTILKKASLVELNEELIQLTYIPM